MRLRSFVSYKARGTCSASTHKISEKSMATVLQNPGFAIEKYSNIRIKKTKKWQLSIESSRLRPGPPSSVLVIRNHVPAALKYLKLSAFRFLL